LEYECHSEDGALALLGMTELIHRADMVRSMLRPYKENGKSYAEDAETAKRKTRMQRAQFASSIQGCYTEGSRRNSREFACLL